MTMNLQSTYDGFDKQLAERTAELNEAREQQAAIAEILQAINNSDGDPQPVFDAILDRAIRVCGAALGTLLSYDGERFNVVAVRGEERFAEFFRGRRLTFGPGTAPARILAGERVVHSVDAAAEAPYTEGDPARRALVDLGGARTQMAVPLLKGDKVHGIIGIFRQEVRPFTDRQIALLQSFAEQAVIVLGNMRLIADLRQRTGDLQEALDQQTATTEILRVINSSPGDLAPVFDAMLDKAMHLCGAAFGTLLTYDGGQFTRAAMRGDQRYLKFAKDYPPIYVPGTGPARILQGERVVHILDLAAEAPYRTGHPNSRALVDLAGARTVLAVPLLKGEAVHGVITIFRQEVRAFSERQIVLLQGFAAQAVIAMENARLITDLRQRTGDLQETLDQQTATTEILQTINGSPGDPGPVFDAILDKALSLCGAALGSFSLYDGENFTRIAVRGDARWVEYAKNNRFVPRPGNVAARILAGEQVVHIADLTVEPIYLDGEPNRRMLVDVGGVRSLVSVALAKGGATLGLITIFRQEMRPFTDRQIALLQNFAAQAVIAIENARLITDLRQRTGDLQEALDQQTATTEILQVINSSPGDLTPVFNVTLDKALRLCGAAFGTLLTYDGERFHHAAVRGGERYTEFAKQDSPIFGPGTAPARILAGEQIVHIRDLAAESRGPDGELTRRMLVDLAGARTLLGVPLLKGGTVRGVITIFRQEVRPYSDKQIALLQSVAAQAVIAMENARLITELQQRTADLQESLDYQTAVGDVLKVISRSTVDLEAVLETVVVTAIRLCHADSAVIYRNYGGEYRWAVGHMLSPEYENIERAIRIKPGTGSVVGRAALQGTTVQIADAWTDPLYEAKDDARIGGVRSMIGVPLLREGVPIGVIGLARNRIEPFSEREIQLVTTFADQSVIAIENARLFTELNARTLELARSIEEMQLLSEIGQAVSSTLDLQAVLSTVLSRSVGLACADAGAIFGYDTADRAFWLVESFRWDAAMLEAIRDRRIPETETAMGDAVAQRVPVHIKDLADRPSAGLRDASFAAGFRSVLIVPLIGVQGVLGALVLQRRVSGQFPPATVRLMQSLASQSVLAIQNAEIFHEIADKSEKLELASQHKSQFLANMSHELRTPLNAILGYAELLVDGIYGDLPDKPREVLERIQTNGRHLLGLINDVLDLTKIEAGQLTLTLEDYSLAEVVQSVVTATEPLAVEKQLKFTAHMQDDMPVAHGDARRVSQVLLNLVGNAIKFTDKGEVEVCATAENGQLVLTVRDTGPGIAEADQERIFAEFQQIDNSNTREKGGSGLGLAISKRIVELHGGTISVESALGRGSLFRVELPVRVDALMVAA